MSREFLLSIGGTFGWRGTPELTMQSLGSAGMGDLVGIGVAGQRTLEISMLKLGSAGRGDFLGRGMCG